MKYICIYMYRAILINMFSSIIYAGPSLTKHKMQCQRHAACAIPTEQVIIWMQVYFPPVPRQQIPLGGSLTCCFLFLHLTDHLYRLGNSLTWLAEEKNVSLSTGFFKRYMNMKCPAERGKVIFQSLFFKNCRLVLKKSI